MSPSLKIKRAAASPDPAPPSPTPSPAPAPVVSGEATTRVRPLVPPRAPKNSKNSARVLLPVLDGKIEWEKMTPEARKAFEDLFKDREFLGQFGLTGKEKMFDPEQIKYLYGAISAMYQTVIRVFLRWPDAALKMLAYSDDDKDALAGPTANLANKFAPLFLQKHSELIVWGAVFGSITQKNFLAASAEAKKLMGQKQPALQRPLTPEETARRAAQIITRPNSAPAPALADRPAPVASVPFAMPSVSDFAMTEGAGASLESLG